MDKLKRQLWCISTFVIILYEASAQELPNKPVSYRVFDPFIYNPAIAGSKDYSNLDLLLSSYGNSNSELASLNMRISKDPGEYLSSQRIPEFTNFGIGAYLYNDKTGPSQITGAGGTFSYHLQMDKKALSFLSFGISAKAALNNYSGEPDLNKPAERVFFPELDAGIYYYTPSFYAGLSATNLLGNPGKPDTLGNYITPVSRQLNLNSGYKIVLNRDLNIILEPSLIVNSDFAFSGKIKDMLKPGLKLYAGNFSVGTFFNEFDKISFYLQYMYSKVFIGTFFELPYNAPFFKNPILAEFAIGINLSGVKSGFPRRNHW